MLHRLERRLAAVTNIVLHQPVGDSSKPVAHTMLAVCDSDVCASSPRCQPTQCW